MRLDLGGISLADRKAAALLRVDAEAEATRLLWITDGSGQSQEYRLTEAQARAYVAASYPTPFDASAEATYPMVHAEMLARADAGTVPYSTQTDIDAAAALVADSIISDADAWLAAAKTIKRLRRTAKLKIEAATTHAAVHAALQITWPAP